MKQNSKNRNAVRPSKNFSAISRPRVFFRVSGVLASFVLFILLQPALTRAQVAPPSDWSARQSNAPLSAVTTITATKTVDKATANPGDTLSYTVIITDTTADATNVQFTDTLSSTLTLSGTVAASPVAVNDTYPQTLVGNVSINSALIGYSVTANDYLGQNPTATISAFDATSAHGGNVTMTTSGADIGKFTYDPPAGYTGGDSFTYTLSDNANATSAAANRTATVSLTISGMVWFINNNAGACSSSCDGRLSHPFTTLTEFNALNDGSGNNPAANDNIFVYESATSYTGGVTLLSGQKLIGQDSTSALATITGLTPPSSSPSFPAMNIGAPATTILNAGGNGVTLNSGNTLNGLTVSNSSGSAISGSGFGTLTVADVIVNTTGQALNLTNGTLAATFSSVTSTGGANNIALATGGTTLAGTLTINGGALSNAASDSFKISGTGTSTATISDSGAITSGSAHSVNIANKSGGTVTFSGAVTDSHTGITLASNTGATINFTGGINASTGTNTAFNVTGGGTVNATQNNTSIVNTLTTTTGTALNVSSTTIGGSGLTFRSISSNGAANGIVLNNTGAGTLTVSGNGAANTCKTGTTTCSGGTIQSSTADGISLTSTKVNLSLMWIKNNANSGIKGTTVSGFTATDILVQNNTNAAGEQAGILINDLTDSNAQVTRAEVSGSKEDNVRIHNSSTTGTITFTSCTVIDNDSNPVGAGNQGIFFESSLTGNLTGTVTNSTLHGNRTIALRGDSGDGSTLSATFTNNTITAGSPNQGNQGIEVSRAGTSTLTFNVTGNTVTGMISTLINVFSGGGPGTATGDVKNNIATGTGVGGNQFGIRLFNSGSSATGFGTMNVNVANNTVTNIDNAYPILGESSGSTGTGGLLKIAVTGNTANVAGAGNNALDSIRLQSRNTSTVCAVVNGNTTNSGGPGFFGIQLREANTSTFNLEGLTTGAQTDPTVHNYVVAQNPSGGTVGTLAAVGNASITGVAPGSCGVTAMLPLPITNRGVAMQYDASSNDNSQAPSTGVNSANAFTIPFDFANLFKQTAWVNPSVATLPANIANAFSVPLVSVAEASTLPASSVQPGSRGGTSHPSIPMFSGETVSVGPIATLPAGKSVTIKFQATIANPFTTGSSVSNQGTVSGTGFSNVQTTVATTNINLPDLQAAKTNNVSGSTTLGSNWTWTIPVTNTGTFTATFGAGQTILSDNLPDTNIAYGSTSVVNQTGISGTGTISCSITSNDLTCTASGGTVVIAATTGTFGVQFTATPTATGTYANPRGGGSCSVDPNNVINEGTNESNNACSDSVTVTAPDLTIAKSHTGNFAQGQLGATYTITATNIGNGSTSSTVYITDTLPSGLTATGFAGTGWTCTLSPLACSRADALSPSSTYASLTLTVTVAANAPAVVTNTVQVAGGGETVTNNDTANDQTNITQISDLTIAKTHNGDFSQGQTGATYTITATNSAFGPTSGTVTVTDALPAGLTATGFGGTNWTCAALPTLSCTRSDALAPGNSYEPMLLTVDVALNAASPVTNTATISGGGEVNTSNDSVDDQTTILSKPDLTIAKTHVGNFRQGDIGDTYTLTVTNTGAQPTDGTTVTVTDALPSGLTATGIAGSGWTCTQPAGSCTRSDVLIAGASYPALTLTVTVAANATSPVTNSATVAGGGELVTSNDTANDLTNIAQAADLTISKSHSGNFRQGDTGDTYTLTVHNPGAGATNGSTVTVTDTLPSGLTATGMSGTGWTCTVGTLTCTSTAVVASGFDFPSITLTVTVAGNATSTVTNTATVAGGGELTTSNDSASDPTTITPVADLTIAKTHSGNFAQGQVGATYTITVSNTGPGPTNGSTVTVTDTLPSGLTATGLSAPDWSCILGTLTCTTTDIVPAGSAYPTITLTVNVDYSASAVVTNTATVAGGGEIVTSNDTTNDQTNITQYPDLTITKTHSGTFIQGDAGRVYTITVTNSGSVPTNGSTVTVTDTMPAGLSAVGLSGTGWNCNIGTLDCTRNNALAAGASYAVITFTVDVANNATSGSNVATVAGGGEINTGNDTASDSTTITPFQNITISGTKFNDLNGNGSPQGGEPGVPSWTIQLIDPSNSNVISTTTTDASGNYSFPNLAKSTYRVREVAQAGWQQTTANPADITAQSGVNVTGINFGNFQQITLSGTVFNDLNADGLENGSDVGLSSWTVNITNTTTSITATTTTNASGNYGFPNLGPGTYRVREVLQAGWVQTNGNPADVTASSGTNVANVNFGNVLPANLTITKTASTTHPAKGGLLTYTLVATNTGPNTAQTVVVTDTTPTHTVFQSLTHPAGWTCTDPGIGNTGTMNCSKASMTNGGTATFQFVVKVDANTPDNTTLSNTAFVSASTFQSTMSGNHSTAQATVGTFFYYLPFIGRNITIGPDLIVQSISAPGNSDIQVVIKNIGNQPTGSGFWVDLYVNPSPVPTQVNQTWPFVSSQGAVWGITSSINPGGTVTLNIGDANYWPSSGPSPLSNLPATLPAGTQIYIQVDSARAGSSYGAILETNEANNITGVQLAAPVTLPANHAPARQLPYKNLPNRE